MKKYVLPAVMIFISGLLPAQSPRILLLENFAHASSGASSLSAPGLHDLQEFNENRMVYLEYHPLLPGIDPMYAANPVEMQARAGLYGVVHAPVAVLNGIFFTGQPDNLPQSLVDSLSNLFSPFEISLQHQVSVNNDTIFVTMVVRATQAFNGNPDAFIAVSERNIYFSMPPGTTPQKKFEHVMRKMLPAESGTSLQQIWNANDSVVIMESWPLSGISNPSQLSVAGWIQDSGTMEVLQAGYSRTHLALDIGVVSAEFPPVMCPGAYVQKVKVKNFGTDVLTSCTVGSRINQGSTNTKAWTGSVLSGDTKIISLDTVILAPGQYMLATAATIPNSGTDEDPENDSNFYAYTVLDTVLTIPLYEGFEGPVFPPAHWTVANAQQDVTWEGAATGAYGSSLNSAFMNCFDGTRNRIDELYLPALDFSNVSGPVAPSIRFDYAYAFFTDSVASRYDTLKVEASSDCGSTWTTLWQKGGNNLATAPPAGVSFTATGTQWQRDSISLSAFLQVQPLLIKFHAASGRGNNLYIDNVNIDFFTGMDETEQTKEFGIYPVPSSGTVTILNKSNKKLTGLTISDPAGKTVYRATSFPENAENHLRLEFLSNGVYLVVMEMNGYRQTGRLVILHHSEEPR